MKLFYRELGNVQPIYSARATDRQAPNPANWRGYAPIIILHGLFGMSDNWLTIGKKLAEKHKVYIPDLRNHGRSPHNEAFNYRVMVDDLVEFIDDLHLPACAEAPVPTKSGSAGRQNPNSEIPNLIGHSLGGKVAMQFAMKYPEKLQKLVVVDIAPKYYQIQHDSILTGLLSLKLSDLKTRRDADTQLAQYVPEFKVRQFLLKNLCRKPHKTNKDAASRFAWRINLPVISRGIENIGEWLIENKCFDKPTLFVKGGKSQFIDNRDIDLIKKLFPNSQITTIENAGHWVHADAPEEFLDVINDFLQTQYSSSNLQTLLFLMQIF
ncbi:MAG: alpha/beta fold hydrolase [Cytophagales bacterium]|nr:alpha/beta fold hydrolase [Cytophagales bacterium]